MSQPDCSLKLIASVNSSTLAIFCNDQIEHKQSTRHRGFCMRLLENKITYYYKTILRRKHYATQLDDGRADRRQLHSLCRICARPRRRLNPTINALRDLIGVFCTFLRISEAVLQDFCKAQVGLDIHVLENLQITQSFHGQ